MSSIDNSDVLGGLKQNSWPFQEAYKLLHRKEEKGGAPIVFETGYGPSGLPHIGTFGEVVRTAMIRRAFQEITDYPSRLICFSDDLDGLRKVPENIPNPEKIRPFLEFPLTRVPDPFGTHKSFGEHNNSRLRAFLDSFGFQYEFMSATECYTKGVFDKTILKILDRVQEISDLILPTLGEERQKTYSPFLPISPSTGRVLQVPILEYNTREGAVVFQDEDGKEKQVLVTGGNCKLQWKVDWAMRWAALGVDYEIYGKDIFIGTLGLSQKICKVLGVNPPDGFSCELFLDEEGRKISKSKGNGLSTEEWLKYGPPYSLRYFMYHAPRRAKSLFFGAIPKSVDEILSFLGKYAHQTQEERLDNPAWHVFEGTPPGKVFPVSFSLLLNLVGVCGGVSVDLLWRFVEKYLKKMGVEVSSEKEDEENKRALDMVKELCRYAITYYENFIAPYRFFPVPTEVERLGLEDLLSGLKTLLAQEQGSSSRDAFLVLEKEALSLNLTPEGLQTLVYEVGKRHFSDLKTWFQSLYSLLLGQKEGPRMGSFIALFGVEGTCNLIEKALGRKS
jgi:lysyl-tRNA synthetase class 1